MKTLGYDSGDLSVDFLIDEARDTDSLIRVEDISAECIVKPDFVSLDFVGQRHIPQLAIGGFVDQIKIRDVSAENVPYGLKTVRFAGTNRPRIESHYEFSTEQLMSLVNKGLYAQGFAPPEDWMMSVPWEVPAKVALNIVPVEYDDAIVPIILVDIDDQFTMTMNQRTSGYNLAEVFANHREKLEAEGRFKDGKAVELGVDKQFEDSLFADLEAEERDAERQEFEEFLEKQERERVLEASGLDRLVKLREGLGIDSEFVTDMESLGEVSADDWGPNKPRHAAPPEVHTPDVSQPAPQPDKTLDFEDGLGDEDLDESRTEPETTTSTSSAPEEPQFVQEEQSRTAIKNLDHDELLDFFDEADGLNGSGDGLTSTVGVGSTDSTIDFDFDKGVFSESDEELIAEEKAQEQKLKNMMRIRHGQQREAESAESGFVDFDSPGSDMGPSL